MIQRGLLKTWALPFKLLSDLSRCFVRWRCLDRISECRAMECHWTDWNKYFSSEIQIWWWICHRMNVESGGDDRNNWSNGRSGSCTQGTYSGERFIILKYSQFIYDILSDKRVRGSMKTIKQFGIILLKRLHFDKVYFEVKGDEWE